jgi:hypothetical protein
LIDLARARARREIGYSSLPGPRRQDSHSVVEPTPTCVTAA